MPADSARAVYEVVAGIIPGEPDGKWTRRFGVTSAEYEQDGTFALLRAWHGAVADATDLQLRCAGGYDVNWVHIDFVWP